ncbi:hypothetical protein [Salidesulfovibrio onnuriiensis]|uniref:hypothetical protein n=1 Tax=Salidesulfovibrio onnuriiensis TaxID=2583823 RepID=UPI0011C8EDCE|nr:hypothetical protein [Salidesulfovibrio onnuriiensis]
MHRMYPVRSRLARALAARGLGLALLLYLLHARFSRPNFYESGPDIYVLVLLPLAGALACSAALCAWRMFRSTPWFATSTMGVFLDCSLLGPTTIRWDDIDQLGEYHGPLHDSLAISLLPRGLERLGFRRRLWIGLGLGGNEGRVHVPANMIPTNLSELSAELNAMIRHRGRIGS